MAAPALRHGRYAPGAKTMSLATSYDQFLGRKSQLASAGGFEPLWMPAWLYRFQADPLVGWALRQGRAAVFADCGLGKTPCELVWAENVARRTGRPVLIATPLAVSYQTVREAKKFGIDAVRVADGQLPNGARIVVTNYERLGAFSPEDFGGMACDESSILKNYNGVRRKGITRFMNKLPYRSLWTATAAPNDFPELGTSSEALGGLTHTAMLERFFKKMDAKGTKRWTGGYSTRSQMHTSGWRFRGHAETPFWRWVASWARAARTPADLGFPDDRFTLPPLRERIHEIAATEPAEGMLFVAPARGLGEQREERKQTLRERCEKVAELVSHDDYATVWCQYNSEGDMLTDMIPGAVQVKGAQTDAEKEARLRAFAGGRERVLVTKPKIGAWGLNLQHCAHVVTFPSHSYEQDYQLVRRCYRFGQKREVTVDRVTTPGEARVLANLERKTAQAERMFERLVAHMRQAEESPEMSNEGIKTEAPRWL